MNTKINHNRQDHLTHPKYRPDIDGLRAVAVLSIVSFHAFPDLLKGGFVGVDIFFVISGFLISTIIFESLAKESFSFSEFYARRIKRIFPALIAMMAISYIIGWFTLFNFEYSELGKQMAAGAAYVPNIFFWLEVTNYWSGGENKLMLHLWSLGVEEQFYLLWPLLTFLAYKRKINLLLLVMGCSIISFALNAIFIYKSPSATFYLPVTRLWELLIGSILAYLRYKKIKIASNLLKKEWNLLNSSTIDNIQSVLGILLIGFAVLFLDNEKVFPGWWALLPTIGAYFIISAGQQAWVNRIILSHPVSVWFGLISYPLYLWHWPLLSLATVVGGQQRNYFISAILFLASIVLAWLTFRFIEKPLKLKSKSKGLVTYLLCFDDIYRTDRYYHLPGRRI